MNVLVMGPTGAVGAECVRQSIQEPRIEKVVAVSRRPLKISDAKLKSVLLSDFSDYSEVAEDLKTMDVCFCALGISATQEKNYVKYYQITHDYPLMAARELLKQNPSARFHFVSGLGADPSLKSKTMWRKVKGETENDLRKLLGDRLTIFRPGYIYPIQNREQFFILDPLSYPLYWLRGIFPDLATDTVEVANAMIHVALENKPVQIVGNREIRKRGKDQWL